MQFTFDRINNNKYLNTIYSDELLENGTFVAPKVDPDYAHFNDDLQVWELIYPDGYVEPKNVPEKVSRRQLRQALILSDFDLSIIDQEISKIEDIKTRLLMKSFWNDSQEFERYHERLISFATDLGFTEEQTDNLFILADTL